jgi:hypothetical protein
VIIRNTQNTVGIYWLLSTEIGQADYPPILSRNLVQRLGGSHVRFASECMPSPSPVGGSNNACFSYWKKQVFLLVLPLLALARKKLHVT